MAIGIECHAFAAGSASPMVTVSSKGLGNSLSTVANAGFMYGPDTVGTTTSGLQEAINSGIQNAARSTPPAGGTIIQLQPGTYQCTSQIIISNRFANPISIQGVSDAPSTVINYRGSTGKDFITSAAADGGPPAGQGNLSLNLRNLILSYEPFSKNYICNFTDIQRLMCENVYFCTWSFLTNGGLDGNVFPSYKSDAGAFVVGVKLGTFDFSDSTFGLAYFKNCRFANLAAGGVSMLDHCWMDTCHYLLIGGANRNSPTTNAWAAGVSFTVPDSMFAMHPAWVNYSAGGDLRLDNPAIYSTFCFLLNAKQGTIGHPVIRNTTASGLEQAAWVVLQYDDINTGVPGQRVEIEAEPEQLLLGCMSLVAKPGTVSYRYPTGVKLFKGPSSLQGGFTNYSSVYSPGLIPGTTAATYGFNWGTPEGRNRGTGHTLLDRLSGGISVGVASVTVSGGTDSGINGTYFLSDRTYIDGTVNNTYSFTNANYAIVPLEGILNVAGSGYGAIYNLTDKNMATPLYDCNGSFTLYPGYNMPMAGAYTADTGVGTPPTVTFTFTTNNAFFAGKAVANDQFVGSGQGVTNVFRHAKYRKTACMEINGSSVVVLGDIMTIEASATATFNAPTATEGTTRNVASLGSTTAGFGDHGNNNWRTGRNIYFGGTFKLQENAVERVNYGVSDAATTAAQCASDTVSQNYAVFRYSTAAGDTKWQCVTGDGTATPAVTASTVNVDTAIHLFEIFFDDSASKVYFRIDGVSQATNTTHLPTAGTNLRYVYGGQTLENVAKNVRTEWLWVESDR